MFETVTRYYTKDDYDNCKPIPFELEEYLFRNSDGEMMDDNWSDYVMYYLDRYFDNTDDDFKYEIEVMLNENS